MSVNKIVFTTLFLSLNGLIFCHSSFAQATNDTDNSTTTIPAWEMQTGVFDPNWESTTNDSPSAFLSAPLPGLGTGETSENFPQNIPDVSPFTAKSNNSQILSPIIMRRIISIILDGVIDSKFVKVGDPIRARLKEDLYYGSRLIAPANSILNGHVTSFRNGRTLSSALIQNEDRLNSNAALEIQFDSLVAANKNALPLFGRPVHQETVRMGKDGLLYGVTVDRQGKIVQGGRTLSRNQKNTYNMLRVATAVPIPAGLFVNIAAAPLVMGTVGAVSPELAFNKPPDASMNHKRLKGMAYGFVTNLPGAFFVQAVVEKGNEIVLNIGDELMVDITINSPIYEQSVQAKVSTPETLIVEGKILDKGHTSISSKGLPLKLSIDAAKEQPVKSLASNGAGKGLE